MESGPERRTFCELLIARLGIPYEIGIVIPATVLGYTSSNFGESTTAWFLWGIFAYYMFMPFDSYERESFLRRELFLHSARRAKQVSTERFAGLRHQPHK